MKIIQLICAQCGVQFSVDAHHMRKDRKFCTKKCANEAKNIQDPLAFLLSKCEKQENGCWLFTGYKDPRGYGQICINGKRTTAHHMMWMVWNKKEVPEGHVVRHICIKSRGCINPDHLITGTPLDNVRDEIEQGTFNTGRGEERTTAKLTEEKVRKMRKLRPVNDPLPQYTYGELGNMFGVSAALAHHIVNRKQWVHVAD